MNLILHFCVVKSIDRIFNLLDYQTKILSLACGNFVKATSCHGSSFFECCSITSLLPFIPELPLYYDTSLELQCSLISEVFTFIWILSPFPTLPFSLTSSTTNQCVSFIPKLPLCFNASTLFQHSPFISMLSVYFNTLLLFQCFHFISRLLPYFSTSNLFQQSPFLSMLPLYFDTPTLFQCFHFIPTLPLYFNVFILFQHSLFTSMFSFYSNTLPLFQFFHFISILPLYFNVFILFQHSPFISMFSFYSNTPPLFQCVLIISVLAFSTLPPYFNISPSALLFCFNTPLCFNVFPFIYHFVISRLHFSSTSVSPLYFNSNCIYSGQ